MARPANPVLIETHHSETNSTHQVVPADAIYVVTYRHQPFLHRVQTGRFKRTGNRTYLPTSHITAQSAITAAQSLNERFSTQDFQVKKVVF